MSGESTDSNPVTDPLPTTEINPARAFQMANEANAPGDRNFWAPPAPEDLDPLFPDYDILSLLGRGGMGAVYKGVQKSLERPVAIKLLPEEMAEADPSFAERFRREARAMAALDHSNIVHVYDFGQTDVGQYYIVMEFVNGMDFHQLIHTGQLDHGGALNAVSQICDALEYAHRKGYVHRDIKPANIFINTEGILKVGDFGLAKIVTSDEQPITDPMLTMPGAGMGTQIYSAPEQLDGRPVDQRADIYSLGVMFYEMLTGELPRGHFPPPSKKVPVDARLDHVVLKAMESEPARRYSSACAMRSEVDDVRIHPNVAELAPGSDGISEGSRDVVEGATGSKTNEVRPQSATAIIGGLLAFGAIVIAAASVVWWKPWQTVGEGETTKNRTQAARAGDTAPPPPSATMDKLFVNTLGLEFIPLPGKEEVLMCRTETRVRDFEAFVTATGYDAAEGAYSLESDGWRQAGGSWRDPRFHAVAAQTPDHPVVCVSWDDAREFCRWLTEKEPGLTYRLPSDEEWSAAVGPKSKYPWGDRFPPPQKAGNYAGSEAIMGPLEAHVREVIGGYDDGAARTAKVASYQANPFGFFDLGGNVWEWCEDEYRATMNDADVLEQNPALKRETSNDGAPYRVMRGGSWNSDSEIDLRSSNRNRGAPSNRYVNFGFRCVVESAGGWPGICLLLEQNISLLTLDFVAGACWSGSQEVVMTNSLQPKAS